MKHNYFLEKPLIYQMKNGMKVHLIKDSSTAVYIECAVDFGPLDLFYELNGVKYELPPGSAHFFEHKIFASPQGDIFRKFSEMSLMANAATSHSHTTYSLSGTKNIKEGLLLLLQMLDEPYFTDENVASEEKIIKEEINMYNSDIDILMASTLLQQTFHFHPMRHDILGTHKTISNITKETLSQIHQHFYNSANRILVISGPIDIKEYQSLLETIDHVNNDYVRPTTIYPNEPVNVVTSVSRQQKNTPLEKLYLSLKFNHLMPKHNLYYQTLVICLFHLLIGLTSEFYSENINQGLINSSFNYQLNFEGDVGLLIVYSSTKDSDALYQSIIQTIITKQPKIELEDFNNFKKSYLGSFIQALNDYEYKVYLYSKYATENLDFDKIVQTIEALDYQDLLKVYDKIKDADISRVHVDI